MEVGNYVNGGCHQERDTEGTSIGNIDVFHLGFLELRFQWDNQIRMSDSDLWVCSSGERPVVLG